jgi:hypothetical protein
MEFEVGDYVEILTKDGATFRGVLQDFTEVYFILNGCGFPHEDVVSMEFA